MLRKGMLIGLGLLVMSGSVFAEQTLESLISAVVGIRAEIPAGARTARFLGTEREGNGVLIDEMITGKELIIGAKNDLQFGPVMLIGIGGTAVEIYQDTAIRMAPLAATDVQSMVSELKGNRLLSGYRGEAPISLPHLTRVMLKISDLMMALQDKIESLDLNPVFCSDQHCIVADARIILK